MSNNSLLLGSNTTKSDKNEPVWDSLSSKEKLTLLAILTSKNDEEAIKRAPVSKTQFYSHKKKLEPFRQKLVDDIIGKAVEVLRANSIKAAERLTELLDSPNAKVRQQAAESVLDRSIGRPNVAEQQQTQRPLPSLVLVGVPQSKIDRLFVTEEPSLSVQEGEVVENKALLVE